MSQAARQVKWGGLVLDVVNLTISRGRAFVSQMPARGRGGTLSDRGPELRECRAQVRWVKRHADDDPAARHRALLALHDGKTRLFTHPVDGDFPAKMSLDDESVELGNTTTSVRFLEDRGHADPPGARAGATLESAVERVVASARAAADALGAHGLPSDVAAESEALARSWNALDLPTPADVHTGLNRQTAAIQASLADSGASGDPARLDVYFALLDLSAALADAAELVSARRAPGAGLVELEVHEPVTLLSLAARIYGAALARDQAAAILRLNPQVRSATIIPAPITLTVPSA